LHALQLLRQAGFNRLSLGVQSFNERILKSIGRIHRADEAKNAFNAARAAGFENISFDLMYGLPTQSLADWHDTLQQAVDLSPDHLSAYGLKLEDGTRMELDVRAGRLALPSEDEEEAMYDLLNVFLPQQGYDRYEISNYAPNGKECQHNLKYWRYHPYRGFGVAAHSFNGQDRFANSEDISRYIETVEKCESPEEFRESLDASTAMAEYAFLALRTVNGLSETNFELRFEKKFADYYAKAVSRLLRLGLLIHEKDTWRLTERGMKLGNQAFEEFLP
jgi:oxygen-independent coproporphyrinogen-3 oxidase